MLGTIPLKKGNYMPKLIDLTGSVYGRLKVISRAKLDKLKPYWKCICECGNEFITSGLNLRCGDTQSCGCLRKDILTDDLIGKRFGKLIVINKLDQKGSSNRLLWLCDCDCGNKHIAASQHLKLYQVKSCGCLSIKSNELLLDEAKNRFFSNIEKTDGCWNWKGCNIREYGMMFYEKRIKAHRFSYMIHKGEIEKGKYVCHTCDNPSCVNPEHLYAGTPKQNNDDKIRRGRFKPRGKLQPPKML
jgi:hypothetical protein